MLIQRSDSSTGDFFTIAFWDIHSGEYSIPSATTADDGTNLPYTQALHYELTCAWHPFDLMNAIPRGHLLTTQGAGEADDRLTAAFHALFDGTPIATASWADEAATDGSIMVLDGHREGIIWACERYIHALNDTISGDDTVFDYWPNAIRMITELCNDIDKLFFPDTNDMTEALRRSYDATRERFLATSPDWDFDNEICERP